MNHGGTGNLTKAKKEAGRSPTSERERKNPLERKQPEAEMEKEWGKQQSRSIAINEVTRGTNQAGNESRRQEGTVQPPEKPDTHEARAVTTTTRKRPQPVLRN